MVFAALLAVAFVGPAHARHPGPRLQDPAKLEAQHEADLKHDRDEGAKDALLVEKQFKTSTDTAAIARINRIGGELAAIANKYPMTALWGDKRLNKFNYTFHLLQDKDVNAFSLPGGYIYVNEGLMKYIESDDELAGVLGHEISHSEMRHVATLEHESEKEFTSEQLPLILAAILIGGAQGGAGALGVGQLLGQSRGSGWSQRAELAADYGGFQILTHTNYDPTGLLTVMERFTQDERSNPFTQTLGIFRTHPPSKERAEAVVKYMREANMPIRRSHVCSSMRASDKVLDDGTVRLDFGLKPVVVFGGPDARARADQAVANLNDFFDSTPELYDLSDGGSGQVLGRHQLLMTVEPIDAAANKCSLKSLESGAMTQLRSALYNVSYRVWDN